MAPPNKHTSVTDMPAEAFANVRAALWGTEEPPAVADASESIGDRLSTARTKVQAALDEALANVQAALGVSAAEPTTAPVAVEGSTSISEKAAAAKAKVQATVDSLADHVHKAFASAADSATSAGSRVKGDVSDGGDEASAALVKVKAALDSALTKVRDAVGGEPTEVPSIPEPEHGTGLVDKAVAALTSVHGTLNRYARI